MRRLHRSLKWVGLALLLIFLSSYGIARSGLKQLDEQAREELGGKYLATSAGVLSYTREGALDAPVVILVHGFSTPKFVWEQVTPTLLSAGYQVVTYDHLGRGLSDRPEGPYDSALYRAELTDLIAGLKLQTPLTLIGYSMGGGNVVDFAAANPTMVEQLLLIAPVGYRPETATTLLLKAPVLGEWLATVVVTHVALDSLRKDVATGRAPAGMPAKFAQQTEYRGYTQALLSTVRNFPMDNMADRYRRVGESGIPVTVIWGTDDEVVPYTGSAAMQRDVPQLELVTLTGGQHSITYTQADEVAAALVSALDD